MSVQKLIDQLERAEQRQRAGRSKKKTKKKTAKKRTKKKATKKRAAKKRPARKKAKKKTAPKKKATKRVVWRGTPPAKMTSAQKKAWARSMKRARARKAKR